MDENMIINLGLREHRDGKRCHKARHGNDITLCNIKIMLFYLPFNRRLIKIVFDKIVSKNGMIQPTLKRLNDLWRNRKIHICHPKRDDIIAAISHVQAIMLETAAILSRDNRVEHFVTLLFLKLLLLCLFPQPFWHWVKTQLNSKVSRAYAESWASA